MKLEELNADNVGRPVLIDSINGFENARATFKAWAGDKKTAIVRLNAPYGRAFPQGRLVEVSIKALALQPEDSTK